MNFLFSYPRSGNSLCRYLVEFLSERPTLDCFGVPDKSLNDLYKYDSSLNNKPPILRKSHKIKEMSSVTKDDRVVMVLRDFIECAESCIKRGHPDGFENIVNELIRNIAWFDSFEGQKIVIYYEDMMDEKKIEEVLNKICEFLEIPKDKIGLLLEKFEEHFNKSLKGYSKINGHFTSRQKTHRQGLKPEEIQRRTGLVKNINTEIFEKYLWRFE